MTLRDLKRLLLVYLSALAVLAASVLTSLVLTEIEAQKIASDAQRINDSGRQRTHSQRIIYLAEDLVLRQNAAPGEALLGNYASEELGLAIDRFETAHNALSRGEDASPGELAMYFEAPPGQASLDTMVRDYIAAARGILADPGDRASLTALEEIERGGLLDRLDALVALIERQSLENVAMLRMIGRIALFVALAIVLVEVIFVFLPGHHMIVSRIQQIKAKNIELKEAYETSEQLRLEQAEFTYAVSHDLKSPANTIKLILNELVSEYQDEITEDVQDLLFQATATVDRMGVQIEDILQYAWATGDGEEAQSVNIADSVAEALANLDGSVRSSGARIEVNADATVQGFPRQITMLVQNLIENAIKYQPAGATPVVSLTATHIPGTEGVRITVSDNGIGIDPDNHEKVFGMFQRLHLRSEYAGSGLGLATCRRIAENHHGSIELTSAPGEGAVFAVELYPARLSDASSDERKAA